MVVVGALKYHGAGFKDALVPWLAQVALAKRGRYHRGLHDAEVEQVATQHQEPRFFHQRGAERADHLAVARFAALQVVADGLARHAGAVVVQAARLLQLPHQRGNTARAEEPLA
ncbi:hypothetical protein D3C71_1666260 [compost metagenome]